MSLKTLAIYDYFKPMSFEGGAVLKACCLTKIRCANLARRSRLNCLIDLTKQFTRIQVGWRRDPSGGDVFVDCGVVVVIQLRVTPAVGT